MKNKIPIAYSMPTICTRCFIIQDKNLAISYGREKAGI
jgi:hypothetical protein